MADTERRAARRNRIAQEMKMPTTKNGVGKTYDDKLAALKSGIPGLPTTPTAVKPTDIHSGTPNLDITQFLTNNSPAAQPKAPEPKLPKITVTKADIGGGDGKTDSKNLAALLLGKVSPEQAVEFAAQTALQATKEKYADYDAIYNRFKRKKLTGSDRAIVSDAMQRLGKVMNDPAQTAQDRAVARNAWNRLNTLDRVSNPLTYTAGQVVSGMENTLGSIAGGALQAAGDVVGKATGRTDVGSAGITQLEKYFQANPQDAPTNINVIDPHYIARIARESGVSASAVQSYLENARGALTANFNNNVLGQSVSKGYKNTVGMAAQQIGQQVPGLLLGMGASPSASAESGLVAKLLNREGLGTALKTALKGNVATYLIGASSYSQKINQLARQNNVKAGDYADALGTAFVEYFTEGLFGFSDLNSYKALFNGATGNAKSSILKAVGKYLLSASEEGLEEVVADPMESAIDKAFIDHSIPLMGKGGIFDAQQMLADGVNGAAVALIMGGVANLSGIYSTYQDSRNIQQAASELNNTISLFNQETGASIEPVDASRMTQEQLDTKAAEVLNGLAAYASEEETNAPASTQNEKDAQSYEQPASNETGKVTPPIQQNAATDELNSNQAEKRTTANGEKTIQSVLDGKKRVSQDTLTQEQFDRVADAGGEIDAAGKAYVPQPEQHIDNRDMNSVGKTGVNAFQFDHPMLHSYFQQAAKDLLNDAQASLDTPAVRRIEYTMQGKRSIQEITETPQLRSAMKDAGLSRSKIMDAAQLLIDDHGQENVAAAKRLELILDDMLTNGYTTVYGNTVEPNEKYIKAKSEISGSNPAQHESVIPDELDAVPDDKKTAPETGPEANGGLGKFTEQEAGNLLASAKNKILGFGTSISDFVKSAISTKGNNERLYLGKFPESVVKMVREKTGLNISGFSSIMNGTEAWHAYKDHSNSLTEQKRGQVPLTEDDFSFLPDILSAPDSVSLSPNPDSAGRVALIFAKKIGDKYVTVQGYSKGKKGLVFDTMWINKRKPPVTADTDGNIGQSQTSETSAGTASTDNITQSGEKSNGKNVDTPGDAPKGFDPLSRLQGEQKPSQMHPVNEQAAERTQEERRRAPSDIPKKNLEGHLTSKHASTLANTPVTTNEMTSAIEKELANGNFSRIKYTDSAAASKAEKHIERIGWEAVWAEYRADVKAGKSSKDIVALGQALYNNAVNSNDLMSAMDIASLMIQNAKTTAQALQAMNMINKATPESRLYMVAQSVEAMQDQLNAKYGDKAPELKVDTSLLEAWRDARKSGTEEQQKEAWLAIEQNIADQIPATWQDKLNAWRYLAMLGNPRTHIRNIVGNAGFYPVRMLKNLIATGIESAANIDGRTKSILNPASADDKALLQAGWSDYGNVVDTIQAGGKYTDNYGDVENLRTIFNFKPLEKIRKANGAALDIEDTWFSRPVYAESLAGWLKANGHTAAEFQNGSLSEDTMNEARAYAVKEAQKATYRDTNDFSQWVSRLGRNYDGNSKTGKVANTLVEGVLPFKKTPANILARGVEYSPVGLGKGIYDMTRSVKSGKVTAAEAIDTLSSGMTGTMLAGLGYLLAKLGLATGSADDDDKQKNFDKLRGGQDYALTIGNHNFTIDWLAPEALPFFTGIETYNFLSDKDGYTPAEAFQSLLNLSEPILETSMLSSLEDLLSSVKYADGNYLGTMASTAVTSYLSQFLPTIGGQIERTLGNSSDKRTETFRYGNTDTLGTDVSYNLGKALNKVPGLDYGQIPYIDAWGRTQDQGNIVSRAINNFLNPSYVRKDRSTEVDDELQRLYDAGFSTVLPERAAQSAKINGDYLTKDEYVSYNQVKGKTALSLVSRFMDSEDYRNFTDEERADAIADIYTYANDRAKKAVLESRGETYDSDWDAESELSDIPQYLAVKDSFSKASKNRDYAAMDALIPKYDNLTDQAKDVLDSSAGRLDQITEAQSAGIDSERWYAAYDVWKDIYDTKKEGYSATDKATDFAEWVDGTNLTDDQKSMLKDQLTYSSGFKVSAKSYEALTGAGLSSEAAADVYGIVSSLTPAEGKSTVTTKQKFSAISNMGDLDDGQKLLAMFGFDTNTDNTYERYDAASKAGISPSEWSAMTGKMDNSVSQADLKGAIGSMPWSASQKRAAWNIYKGTKHWKAASPW